MSSEARGSLDTPEHGRVRGWAIDPAKPTGRATIAFNIDGKPFQMLVAEEFRSDLLAAGIGDGCHAFSIELPEQLFDGKPHTIEAKIHGTSVVA